LPIEVSEETLDAIKSWYNEKKEYPYNFPNDEGQFAEGEANCATFPHELKIPLPANTGLLKRYISAMQEKGARLWKR
jgi:hypothetical protein